ncbi:MAG TPA: dUTP diphosphatase [Polyangia bacterium]|nr:dUTP diphosphatase [Polyangia bacterium]
MNQSGPLLRFRKLRPGAQAPRYMSAGAAGMDLASAADGAVRLEPGARLGVPTGLALEIPPGFEGQVRPRSGLAIRAGVTVVNAPGTIDSDYRGEVVVLLVNLGREAHVINPGDRIAQLVIAPVTRVEIAESDSLSDTLRGAGGFGHTGA